MLQNMIPSDAAKGWLNSKDRNSYYVYLLRKPTGVPFYVGKGKNTRVNAHFCPYSLEEDSLKNRTIKKYGVDSCYREIVSYFDNEADAYELERFLMSEVGCILDKSGPLTNVDIPIEGACRHTKSGDMVYAAPRKKYPDSLIFRFYVMEFELCLPRGLITKSLGIERNHQLRLSRGEIRKDLYKKYVSSGLVQNNKKDLGYVPRIPTKDTTSIDHKIREEYNHVINGRKTLKEASVVLQMNYNHVINIFSGRSRRYLGLNYRRDLKVPLKGNTRIHDRGKALELLKDGVGVGEFIKIMNCSREYYYYVRDLFRKHGVLNDNT